MRKIRTGMMVINFVDISNLTLDFLVSFDLVPTLFFFLTPKIWGIKCRLFSPVGDFLTRPNYSWILPII